MCYLGELYVSGRLEPSVYEMDVSAHDTGGLKSLTPAHISVAVQVDGFPTPAFEQKFYRFSVREDTFPGIAVGQVSHNN